MIRIDINAESVPELHASLQALLAGVGNSGSTTTAISTGTVGASGSTPEKPTPRGRARTATADKPNVSAGEERADPTDSATDQAQDVKDEAADTKAAEPAPYKFTHDSVRAVMGGYVQAYGMNAAQEDGPKLIGIAKISEIPDDQKKLAAAVLAIATGIEKNPHKRDIADDGISKEKIAELNPIVLAAQKVV